MKAESAGALISTVNEFYEQGILLKLHVMEVFQGSFEQTTQGRLLKEDEGQPLMAPRRVRVKEEGCPVEPV